MKHLALAVSLSLCAMAGAQASTVELDVSHAQLSKGLPTFNEQHLRAQWNATSADQVGLNAQHVDDFAQSVNALDVSLVHRYDAQFDSYAHVGGSTHGTLLPQYQYGLGGRMHLGSGLTVGLGLDHYKMRDDRKSDVLGAQASYALSGVPLTLRGEADLQRTDNAADGMRYGVGATWGHAGDWTASVDARTGRVDYASVQYPLASADYNANVVKVSARYWVRKNWGLSVQGAKLHNRYFDANQMDAGVFAQF